MNDLRYALRQLRKSPGFTLIAVLTLALGIGANTAIFSLIYSVLLRPLPYPEGDRIAILTEADAHQPSIPVSLPDYLDWKRESNSFEQLALSRRESLNLSGLPGREPEQVSGATVTANFFNVIGLVPQMGRVFTAEEDRAGGPALAVISDRFWQRVFQRDPNVLGRAVNFGSEPYMVIGVMPPEMVSPRSAEVWCPLMRRMDTAVFHNRSTRRGVTCWARLRPGVSLESARTELNGISARLAQTYPASNANVGANAISLLDNQVGEYRSTLRLLFGTVVLVLLIACANLANLIAVRGAAREREFAIRAAVGATRWQIIRQLLIESLVLAALGGLFGFCIAAWSKDLLVAFSPPGVPRFQELHLDRWVLAFTAVLSLTTSVVFGLWPAVQSSRASHQLAVKSCAYGSTDALSTRRVRHLLVVAEIALTLILLSAAGLVLKSFAAATSVSLGFEPTAVLTARLDLPQSTYTDEKVVSFSQALLDKLRQLPGVQHAAVAASPPLMTKGWQGEFLPEGAPQPAPGRAPTAEMALVMGDYFATLQTPVLRGRVFNERDTPDTPLVVIVDQTLAERHFPNEGAVGKRIRIATDQSGAKFRTIVGIVPRLKVYGFDETTSIPQAYLPLAQVQANGLVILARSSVPPQTLEKSLRQTVASIDPKQPVSDFRTMQDRVEETWATPRLMTFLLAIFAGLALLLAVIGLYGVMAYNGLRRTREIGVRLALGARRRQISAMMVGQGMRLLGIGLAIGFAGAFAFSRVIHSLLFNVSANDPMIYGIVTLVLAGAALFACWIPARRASRVNPMVTLRAE